jgi:hypothetical protein
VNPGLLRQLAAVDARQPWFVPYVPWIAPGRETIEAGATVAELLSRFARERSSGRLPRFVPAHELPPGEAYEAFIARTGSVPTRDNLHDVFNGFAWLRFSRAKRRLNEFQAGEIARGGAGPSRGAVRDALTLFDENGAILAAPPAIWESLLARDWRRLFVDLRPLWREAHLVVFGHALLEKLVSPRKALTAHVWAAPAPAQPGASLDNWLAAQLSAERLARKPFTPLPVLGIPGWWPGNEDFSFYDDALVFRPAARQNQT